MAAKLDLLPLPSCLKSELRECALPLPQFDSDGLFKSYIPRASWAPKKATSMSSAEQEFNNLRFQDQMQLDPVLKLFYQKAVEMKLAAGTDPDNRP